MNWKTNAHKISDEHSHEVSTIFTEVLVKQTQHEIELAKLRTLHDGLEKLNQSDQRFAKSLMDNWTRFKKLSISQWEWVDKLSAKITTPVGERSLVPENTITITGFTAVENMLYEAHKVMQFPTIRLRTKEGRKITLRPSPNKRRVKVDYVTGYGFVVNEKISLTYPMPDDVVEALRELAENPVETARKYAKATSSCCFCGIALVNKSSVFHGYGPICAQNYGLPWGDVPVEYIPGMEEVKMEQSD